MCPKVGVVEGNTPAPGTSKNSLVHLVVCMGVSDYFFNYQDIPYDTYKCKNFEDESCSALAVCFSLSACCVCVVSFLRLERERILHSRGGRVRGHRDGLCEQSFLPCKSRQQ